MILLVGTYGMYQAGRHDRSTFRKLALSLRAKERKRERERERTEETEPKKQSQTAMRFCMHFEFLPKCFCSIERKRRH
jgi:hypothetical protein